MKKIFLATAFTALIIFLSGCLKTLHPIFTEKDIVYKPELLGNWITDNNGKKAFANITRLSSENSIELPENLSSIKQEGYLIAYKDSNDNTSSRYIAFLAQVGTHLYFDYYPAENDAEKNLDDFYMAHFIKMHTSYRVDMLKGGGFQLSQLDGDYVKKLLDEKKINIRHETDIDGNVVITAPTGELQQYLIKYGDDPGAYRNDKTIFTK